MTVIAMPDGDAVKIEVGDFLTFERGTVYQIGSAIGKDPATVRALLTVARRREGNTYDVIWERTP